MFHILLDMNHACYLTTSAMKLDKKELHKGCFVPHPSSLLLWNLNAFIL